MARGVMSRAEMEAVIKSGGSVTHNGRVYASVEHLPSEVDLAEGDPAKMEEAEDKLLEERDRIERELAKLDRARRGRPEDKKLLTIAEQDDANYQENLKKAEDHKAKFQADLKKDEEAKKAAETPVGRQPVAEPKNAVEVAPDQSQQASKLNLQGPPKSGK